MLFLLLICSMCHTEAFTKSLPLYDDNDEFIGHIHLDIYNSDPSHDSEIQRRSASEVVPDRINRIETPVAMVTAARQVFTPYPTLVGPTEWLQNGTICGKGSNRTAQILRRVTDSLVVDTQDVCSLLPGLYTWSLTDDFQITFGILKNKIEFGVKHINLANLRRVHMAGTLLVSDQSKIYWNSDSGTYAKPLGKQLEAQGVPQGKRFLEGLMQKVWTESGCFHRMLLQLTDFKLTYPSWTYMKTELCPLLNSWRSTSRLYWKETMVPVCYNISDGCFSNNI